MGACKAPVRFDWVDAPKTSALAVAGFVASEQARAARDGHVLLVYVGASWCEPCRYFHDAALNHELDAEFSTLRIIAFDADVHQAGLAEAGYSTRLIPSFAIPGASGRASGRHIEGSVKGPGAVAEITPRLRALLAPP